MKQITQIQKNTIWNAIAGIINASQSVVIIMIVSRLDSLDTVGMITIGFSLATLFMMLGKFGGRYYQLRHEGYDISGRTFLMLRIFTTISMVIVAVCYIAASYYMGRYSLEKSIIILGITFWYVVEVLEDYYIANYQIENRLDVGNQMFITRWLCIIVIFAVVEVFTHNVIWAIMCSCIVAVVAEVLLLFLTRKIYNPHRCEDMTSFNNIAAMAFPIAVSSTLAYFISTIPKYAIDTLANDRTQAIYGYISIITFALPMLSSMVYQPRMIYYVEDYRNGSIDSIKKRISKQILAIFVIFSVSLVLIYLFGVPILSWLYNAELEKYRTYMLALWIGGFFLAIAEFYNIIMIVAGKQIFNMLMYAVTFLFGTSMTFYLVGRYSLLGATIGYVLTMFIQMICMGLGVRYILKIKVTQTDAASNERTNEGRKKAAPVNDEKERPDIRKRLKKTDVPDEWLEILRKPDGGYKKVVMYHMSLPDLMNDTKKALTKMAEVMEVFCDNSDKVVIWWRPHPLAEIMLKDYRTDSYYDAYGIYTAIKDEFIQGRYGIYDDTYNYDRAAKVADAYYGSGGMELPLCIVENMPIMIHNINIIDRG